MGHPEFCSVMEESSRASRDAHTSESMYGTPGKNKCRSFDCGTHDETVSAFAQDDNYEGGKSYSERLGILNSGDSEY
jgi:hypothetical protein